MQQDGDPGEDLLVRTASGSSARRILRTLVGDSRPAVVRLSAQESALVLWVGDVLIRDAVPLAAAVIDLENGVATPLAVAVRDGCGDGVVERLARAVLPACAYAGARHVVVSASGDDGDLVELCRFVAADRQIVRIGDRRLIDLSAP
ncbi:MAG: hypothetical protein AB7L17_22845 [Ilumatobacteraceae bacterium]